MDNATADYYRRYAQAFANASEARLSAMLPHIQRALPAGARVLDVGAGSGRDVAAMLGCGFDAFGVEPNPDMLALALQVHPALKGRILPATLPDLGRPFSDRIAAGFDAVVCSAVLMHLEPAEIPRALGSMVAQLRAATRDDVEASAPALLVSLAHLEASRLTAQRDAEGRRFYNHDVQTWREQLATLDLSLERSIESDAAFAATGTRWQTLVFRRRA